MKRGSGESRWRIRFEVRGIERLLHKLSKQYLEERKVVAKAGAMMDEGFYGRSESWYCEAG